MPFSSISANYAHPIIEATAAGRGRGRADRYSRVHAKHVSDIAAACFSFSATPYDRPETMSYVIAGFHCDSRIAVRTTWRARIPPYSIALRFHGIPIPPYFYWH